MTRHKHAKVIHAWADGAEIEGREVSTGQWIHVYHPEWWVDQEYRIKPEKTYRIGQRFELGAGQEVYLLCSINFNTVSLNNLEKGTQWVPPTNVGNKLHITEKEMLKITANHKFKLVK